MSLEPTPVLPTYSQYSVTPLPAVHWNVALLPGNVLPGVGLLMQAALVVQVAAGVGVAVGVGVGVELGVAVCVGVGVAVGVGVGVGEGVPPARWAKRFLSYWPQTGVGVPL